MRQQGKDSQKSSFFLNGDRLNAKLHALVLLNVPNHFKKVSRRRATVRAKHLHQSFGRCICAGAQLLKSNRRVNVIAQQTFPCVEFSAQQQLHALTE